MAQLSSTADSAIARECWEAAVPLEITLCKDEIGAFEAPRPLFVLAPWHWVFPVLGETAVEFFGPIVPKVPGATQEPCFEYAGQTLPWHVPVGVLHDILARDDAAQGRPWQVSVRIRGPRTATSAASHPGPWQAIRASLVQSYLFNSLKEASAILGQLPEAVLGMPGERQDRYVAGVGAWDRDRIQQVLSTVLSSPASRGGRPPCIPVRTYVVQQPEPASHAGEAERGAGASQQPSSRATCRWEQVRVSSRPWPVAGPDGAPTTVEAVLRGRVSWWSSMARAGGEAARASGRDGAGGEGAGDGAGLESAPSDALTVATVSESAGGVAAGADAVGAGPLQDGTIVETLGVPVPLDAPLQWLYQTLGSPDGFLHLVIRAPAGPMAL